MEKSDIAKDKFFDDGKFNAVKLRDYIIDKYNIIYVDELGFMSYSGKIWIIKKDIDIKHIIDDLLDIYTSNSNIKETVALLKAKSVVSIKYINNNRNRLVLKNGTLDIENWENIIFHENEYFKDDYCTVQLNINYRLDAKNKVWKEYLKTTFNEDEEIIDLVHEMLGYCMQPSCKLEKAFLLYGNGGTGKSKILNLIEYIYGTDNVSDIPLNDLDNPFSRSFLYNKLVNKSSELEGTISDTAIAYFKKITSGEQLDAQFKYKDVFKFTNISKLIFSTNNFPEIKDKSNGVNRRLIIIPFKNKVSENMIDINLDKKLQDEADGIFMEMVEGLKRLGVNGNFTKSSLVQRELEVFMHENNHVLSFFEENVEEDKNGKISSKDLYNVYVTYCNKLNLKTYNNVNFGKEVNRYFSEVKKGLLSVDGKRENFYIGINFKIPINKEQGKIINVNFKSKETKNYIDEYSRDEELISKRYKAMCINESRNELNVDECIF
ncbi:MAG TPA: hypothetical protein DEP72_03785 [Clostridiales bacterium]|nr:MAG: hypothetical protein A2Y18_05285 [Clostridiales bacterium GWD2_32_19]HCC07275.1 hypothetical protein [Clostridiales bacterium]